MTQSLYIKHKLKEKDRFFAKAIHDNF